VQLQIGVEVEEVLLDHLAASALHGALVAMRTNNP
jgi:hypothetical protein